MEEIFDITNTVTVLKDGQFAGEAATAETNEEELIRMMVGRDLSVSNSDEGRTIGEEFSEEKLLTLAIKTVAFDEETKRA